MKATHMVVTAVVRKCWETTPASELGAAHDDGGCGCFRDVQLTWISIANLENKLWSGLTPPCLACQLPFVWNSLVEINIHTETNHSTNNNIMHDVNNFLQSKGNVLLWTALHCSALSTTQLLN